MQTTRNYWVYSLGLGLAWMVALILVYVLRGPQVTLITFYVFLGFCIGWVSTTIARYVYPPPKKWTTPYH